MRVSSLGGEVLFDRGSGAGGGPTALYSADLVAVVLESGSTRVVASFAELLGDPPESYGRAAEFAPFPIRDRCSAQHFVLYDPLRNEVRGFNADGVQTDAHELPPPRLEEITVELLVKAVIGMVLSQSANQGLPVDSATLHTMIEQGMREDPDAFAGVFPEFVDLRCTEGGTIWIQPFDLESGQVGIGPAWLRVMPDGSIDEYHLPDRFDPLQFTDDRIWGMQRDEYDVESVAWIDLAGMR